MLADFKANLLISQVRFCAKARIIQCFGYFHRIIGLIVRDIHDHSLSRCQPGREQTGVLFSQNTDEALDRTQDGPVDHHRYMAIVVFAHISGTQTTRQGKVELHGTTLPRTIKAIVQGKFNFGTVERPFTRLQIVLQTVEFQRFGQGFLGAIPHLVGADTLLGTSGELDHDVLEAKGTVDVIDHTNTAGDLFHDLLFSTEDVRVILSKAAHPHQTVQGA